ncbi:hypothetical protein [Candidatus Puniceispirillum sp.]|uniref:hypothetical protein n=1 Tax=Candidatus Puniceispirillum sp. TaxID=2026719 RepID=UPI003F6A4B29
MTAPLTPTPRFGYGKPDAHCDFCSRTRNPHPDFDEPIPTALLTTASGRAVELCLSCYEHERDAAILSTATLAQRLDQKISTKDSLGPSLKPNKHKSV